MTLHDDGTGNKISGLSRMFYNYYELIDFSKAPQPTRFQQWVAKLLDSIDYWCYNWRGYKELRSWAHPNLTWGFKEDKRLTEIYGEPERPTIATSFTPMTIADLLEVYECDETVWEEDAK